MRKNFQFNKLRAIKTFGYSMVPLLHDGDVIYLKKESFNKINVNDIICIKKNGKIFTHRVIYKTPKYLITRGDNSKLSDGKISPKNVLGLVYKIKRRNQVFNISDLYLIQSSIYFQELIKVNKALDKQGVELVFPRGLPLYMFIDGTYPKRPYVDSDILIEAKQTQKVKKVLQNLGYNELDTSLSKIQKNIKKKASKTSFLKYVNNFPVVIDVHWEVGFMMTQMGRLDSLYPQVLMDRLTQKFIKESIDISLQGERFKMLSPSNLIVYYALHIFHHNFKGAYKFDVFHRIIESQNADYAEIANTILKYKLANFVYPCFILVRKYFETKLPADFLDSIKPNERIVSIVEKDILKTNIFDEGGRINSGITRFVNRFKLSPNSFFRKSFIFFDKQVLYAIFWILSSRLKKNISILR